MKKPKHPPGTPAPSPAAAARHEAEEAANREIGLDTVDRQRAEIQERNGEAEARAEAERQADQARQASAASTAGQAEQKVADLARAFLSDLPEHAAMGHYQPTARDRWAEEDIDLPDGEHADAASGWTFRVVSRKLVDARRVDQGAPASDA